MQRGVAPEDGDALVALTDEIRLLADGEGRLARVSADDVDRTADVHGPDVDVRVSAYARVPALRMALLERQRAIAADGRLIMAGRDVGTIVLPDADLKFYLEAAPEERARRRALERGLDPDGPEAAEILAELRQRDALDSTRPVAPLRRAPGAIVLRTDGNAFETTVGQVVEAIQTREAAIGPAPPPPAAERGSNANKPRRRRPSRGAVGRGRAAPTPIAQRKDWLIRFGSLVLRVIARLIVRIRIEGDLSAIPETGPLIIAANHASSADPVLIGAFLNGRLNRPLNWLGKRELVETPVIGYFMRRAGIHPVDRATADVEAFRTAMRILDSGNILTVFPEGTRSPDGALQEVRDGAAVLALRSGARVLPVAVSDSDKLWPKGALLPRPGRVVTVRYGKPFVVAEELAAMRHTGGAARARQGAGGARQEAAGAAGSDRREAKEAATRLIMTRIAELLPPRQRGVYAIPNPAKPADRASSEPVDDARSNAG